jgi:hypothetical protein
LVQRIRKVFLREVDCRYSFIKEADATMSLQTFQDLASTVGGYLEKNGRSFTVNRADRVFTARYSQNKNIFTLQVDCATSPLPQMRMRTENRTDRMGKRIGLNREIDTGDEIFDAHVYTESYAADETQKGTLGNENIRQATLFLLQRGVYDRVDFTKRGLSVFRSGRDTSVMDPARFEEALGAMLLLVENLPRYAEWETQTPKVTIGGVVAIGSIITMILAIIFPIAARSMYRPVEWSAWQTGLGIGFAAWLAWIPICGRLVRWRSDAMRNFLISVLLMFAGLPLIGAGSVVFGNGFFDTSTLVPNKTIVTRKWTSRSKNSTNYHTELKALRPGGSNIEISGQRFYNSKNAGSPVIVTTGSGAFGYEWIADYR